MLEKQIEINLKKIDLNRTGYSGLSPFNDLAGIYAFLVEKEKAFYWLDEFNKWNGWYKMGLLFYIKRNLQFDNLRSEQRFQNKITKVEQKMEEYRQQIEGLIPYDISSE